MKPMRCTPVDRDVLKACIDSDQWVMSQKVDGRRALVEVEDGKITAYGRDGQVFNMGYLMNLSLSSALPTGKWLIDGELAKTDERHYVLLVFDLPLAEGLIDFRTPFGERLKALEHLAKLAKWDEHPPLGTIHYATTPQDKTTLVTRLGALHAEGVVLRRLTSPYVAGTESAGYLKYKFVSDADCEVIGIRQDGKDNLVLGVYRDGELVNVGRCTALAGDGPLVKKGDVVTVKYLYLSDDGRLVQPTYPRIRRDKKGPECLWTQLIPASRKMLDNEN